MDQVNSDFEEFFKNVGDADTFNPRALRNIYLEAWRKGWRVGHSDGYDEGFNDGVKQKTWRSEG